MMRRKRQRRRMLLRLIPVIVIMLGLLIGAIVFASSGVLEDLSYSDKKENVADYIGEFSEYEAIVVKDGAYSDERVTLINGNPYIDYDIVKSEYVSRFYRDKKLDQILYTNATETLRTSIGTNTYGVTGTEYTLTMPATSLKGETLYMSLEYLKLFTTIDYKIKGGNDGTPYRIEVYTQAMPIQNASLTADKAIRTEASKKAKILVKPGKGTAVRLISPKEGEQIEEGWQKVLTDDLIIGYIETKHLSSPVQGQIEVTEVSDLSIQSVKMDEPVVLGWSMIAGQAGNDTIYGQLNSAPGMNVISPTWFYLADNEGNIGSLASQDAVNAAHNKGIKVWGMVDNFTKSEITTAYILGDEEIRTKVINSLISLALQYNLDGINIDFESLQEEAGEPFIQFIRELSIQTRANNLVLSVDNYVPKAYTNLYNRKEQGVFADYVIIMGYDEHYNGSEVAGSVASIGYVTDGIEKTIAEVPREKVINALPFYTRMWTVSNRNDDELAVAPTNSDGELITYKIDEVQTLPMQQAIDTAKSHSNATITWDETTKQNYAEWPSGSGKTMMWLEDSASLDAKLQVMSANNIAGVAVWQLGYSEGFAWDTINKYY
ncbi:MAG: glycosyl hydrolase family 18 protein [Lachnospiraceae bacterium]|nr:glycosyl hydrolase family 18 protein [Lachnospiraceae bacterium]